MGNKDIKKWMNNWEGKSWRETLTAIAFVQKSQVLFLSK